MSHFPNGTSLKELWEKRETIAIEYETTVFDLMRSLRYGLSTCQSCKDVEKLEINFQVITWMEQKEREAQVN